MPLFERTRIEIFIPESLLLEYGNLLHEFQLELAFTFGGCSTLSSVEGYYVAEHGQLMRDTINLLFVDIPLSLSGDYDIVSSYCEELRRAAL